MSNLYLADLKDIILFISENDTQEKFIESGLNHLLMANRKTDMWKHNWHERLNIPVGEFPSRRI